MKAVKINNLENEIVLNIFKIDVSTEDIELIDDIHNLDELQILNNTQTNKVIKAKPKSKPKPISNDKKAQQLLDEYYSLLVDTYVDLTNDLLFYFNSETAEDTFNINIKTKITELNELYNVTLTKPTFHSDNSSKKFKIHTYDAKY